MRGEQCSYSNVFHDITSGNNIGQLLGYRLHGARLATTRCGYDLVTGWGSVDAAQLAG